MFFGKDPPQFFDSMMNDHGFKLKVVGIPKYHLGGDFYRNFVGTLASGAHSYISEMFTNYETMFGSIPKEFATPMIKK
jgi:hypothetical protein